MSSHLMRSSSRKKFNTSAQDLSVSLDQKNSMIAVLQSQVQNLRCNEEKVQRLQQCVYRSKNKYQSLTRDYQISNSNNQQRLDNKNKNYCQIKLQCQQLQKQLQCLSQQLKDAKSQSQQLVQHSNIRQDQILQIQYKGDQLRQVNDLLAVECSRTVGLIQQAKQQIQKQRNQAANVHKTVQTIKQKCYKVQAYNRNLIRQEENTSENLSKIQQENNYLDSKITQLTDIQQDTLRQCSRLQNQIQQNQLYKATKQLDLKKVDRQNKQLTKNINLQKSKIKPFNEQWQQKKSLMTRLQNQIRESSQQINYILARSQQVTQVNRQLRKDLKVCQMHLENVLRLNKNIQAQLGKFKQTNLAAIKKLQEPLKKDSQNVIFNAIDLNRISGSSNSWNKHSRLANTGIAFDTSL